MKKLVSLVACLALIMGMAGISSGCQGKAADPLSIEPAGQKTIRVVEKFRDEPLNYKLIDYKDIARRYQEMVFDLDTPVGDMLPAGHWLTPTNLLNVKQSFALLPYLGHPLYGTSFSDGIATIGSVLGSTLAGVDMSNQNGEAGTNWVYLLQDFYNSRTGARTLTNNIGAGTTQSFWNDLIPTLLYFAVAEHYEGIRSQETVLRGLADTWCDAAEALVGSADSPGFEWSSYDTLSKKPVYNNRGFREPDGAGGAALVNWYAYKLFGDEKYLQAAKQCMDWLEALDYNPTYEGLTTYLPAAAARMNVEAGTDYHLERMINWSFELDATYRTNWGVLWDTWGEYDAAGLVGSSYIHGGYGFAMNTYLNASNILPIARYYPSYADAIGKYLLNVAANSRLFYEGELPDGQSQHGGAPHTENMPVAYEAVRKSYNGITPYQKADPTSGLWENASRYDYGLYGGGMVGMMAAMVDSTDVEKILKLDCRATDFYGADGYPTYLLYNPYGEEKTVHIDVGEEQVDLYDAVSNKLLTKKASGEAAVAIPAKGSRLLVYLPAGAKLTLEENGNLYADGKFINHLSPTLCFTEGLQQEDVISGEIDLHLEGGVPSNTKIKSVVLTAGDTVLYEGKEVPEAVKVDTRTLENGLTTFTAEIQAENGLSDRTSINLYVLNEGGRVFSADAQALMTSRVGNASVAWKDEYCLLTDTSPSGRAGSLFTGSFQLDFDKNPVVVLDIAEVGAEWLLMVTIDGRTYGCNEDGPDTGKIAVDLTHGLGVYNGDYPLFHGEHTVSFVLMPYGGKGDYVGIRSLEVYESASNKLRRPHQNIT